MARLTRAFYTTNLLTQREREWQDLLAAHEQALKDAAEDSRKAFAAAVEMLEHRAKAKPIFGDQRSDQP